MNAADMVLFGLTAQPECCVVAYCYEPARFEGGLCEEHLPRDSEAPEPECLCTGCGQPCEDDLCGPLPVELTWPLPGGAS